MPDSKPADKKAAEKAFTVMLISTAFLVARAVSGKDLDSYEVNNARLMATKLVDDIRDDCGATPSLAP